jgi:hypothetical protein
VSGPSKHSICIAARDGLPLAGYAVATVRRNKVRLRHVWEHCPDARIYDGVMAVARRLAQSTATLLRKRVDLVAKDGSLLDTYEPEATVTPGEWRAAYGGGAA